MPSETEIRTKVASLVAEKGLNEAARQLGLHKEAVMRIAAGHSTKKATLTQAAVGLGLFVPATEKSHA